MTAKVDFLKEAMLLWAGACPEGDVSGHLALPRQHAWDTDLGLEGPPKELYQPLHKHQEE